GHNFESKVRCFLGFQPSHAPYDDFPRKYPPTSSCAISRIIPYLRKEYSVQNNPYLIRVEKAKPGNKVVPCAYRHCNVDGIRVPNNCTRNKVAQSAQSCF